MSSEFQPASFPRVQRALLQARSTFEPHRAVFDAVADRLLQRLPLLALKPTRILNLGSRDGSFDEQLLALYPNAEVTSVDPAASQNSTRAASWRKFLPIKQKHALLELRCDPHQLPFEAECFDLIVSNLLLPWCHSPHKVFSEVSRVMSTDGAVLFSSAGPDTLIEYRSLWAKIDTYPHTFGLVDMHDLGDAMLKHGLAAPVLDRENITVSFPTLQALETELRAVGAVNLASGRRIGLMSPSVRRRLTQDLPNGPIKVTLELVQGHAWKSGLQQPQQQTRDGVVIPLDSVRNRLRRRGNQG